MAWLDFMLRRFGPEEYLWLGGYHYGDWLAMDAGEDSYVGATANDLIASAFFAHSNAYILSYASLIYILICYMYLISRTINTTSSSCIKLSVQSLNIIVELGTA